MPNTYQLVDPLLDREYFLRNEVSVILPEDWDQNWASYISKEDWKDQLIKLLTEAATPPISWEMIFSHYYSELNSYEYKEDLENLLKKFYYLLSKEEDTEKRNGIAAQLTTTYESELYKCIDGFHVLVRHCVNSFSIPSTLLQHLTAARNQWIEAVAKEEEHKEVDYDGFAVLNSMRIHIFNDVQRVAHELQLGGVYTNDTYSSENSTNLEGYKNNLRGFFDKNYNLFSIIDAIVESMQRSIGYFGPIEPGVLARKGSGFSTAAVENFILRVYKKSLALEEAEKDPQSYTVREWDEEYIDYAIIDFDWLQVKQGILHEFLNQKALILNENEKEILTRFINFKNFSKADNDCMEQHKKFLKNEAEESYYDEKVGGNSKEEQYADATSKKERYEGDIIYFAETIRKILNDNPTFDFNPFNIAFLSFLSYLPENAQKEINRQLDIKFEEIISIIKKAPLPLIEFIFLDNENAALKKLINDFESIDNKLEVLNKLPECILIHLLLNHDSLLLNAIKNTNNDVNKKNFLLRLTQESIFKNLIFNTMQDLLNFLPFFDDNQDLVNSISNKNLLIISENMRHLDENFIKRNLESIFIKTNSDELIKKIIFLSLRKDKDNIMKFKPILDKGDFTLIWDSLLLASVKTEDKKTIQLLLENGAPINVKSAEGYTALHLAIKRGNEEIVELLLDKGANSEEKDPDGRTALLVAVKQGNTGIVKLLLDKGANSEEKDPKGRTALLVAVKQENTEIVELLLENSANREAKDPAGRTALLVAVKQGNTGIVKLLLENSADVNTADRWSVKALIWAIFRRNIEIVKLLLENSANVEEKDPKGEPALLVAVNQENTEIVELLLENSANVNVKNNNGETALILAVAAKNKEIVELLLDKNAKIFEEDLQGITALLRAILVEDKEIAQLLLNKDANAKDSLKKCWNDPRCKKSSFIIGLALETQDKDLQRIIFESGIFDNAKDVVRDLILSKTDLNFSIADCALRGIHASINVADPSSLNLLKSAIAYNPIQEDLTSDSFEKAKSLLNKGMKVNCLHHGESPLEWAIRSPRDGQQSLELFKLLIQKGASLSLAARSNINLLNLAIQHDKLEVVEFLIKEQAREKRSIFSFFSSHLAHCPPLELAISMHSEEAINFILIRKIKEKFKAKEEDVEIFKKTPNVILAAIAGDVDVIKLLISTERYKDINKIYDAKGKTALDWTTQLEYEAILSILETYNDQLQVVPNRVHYIGRL